MAALAVYATVLASTAIRLGAFIFLRWIPGHPFPPAVLTFLAVYVPAFLYVFRHNTPYNVISDEVRVATRPTDPDDIQDVDPRYTNGASAKDPGQELVVEEEIELLEKDPKAIQTLLTGLPSPSSIFWSGVTFTFNLALALMVLDLTFRAKILHPSHELSMARVGYVSDATARILVREPDAGRFPVFASYRLAEPANPSLSSTDDTWKSAGQIDWLDERTDYTGTFTLAGLTADTRYQYVANNHTGYFTTAPRVGRMSTRAASAEVFTFLHSSCIKLNFPYSPFSHSLSAPGLKYLGQALAGLKAQFMLFLGDFIYIDVPRRHGTSLEDYRREYRQVYASPDWPAVSRDLPWIHVYDDHEVANDWDANTTGIFAAANDPYEHYHISANPPAVRDGETYFSFTQGPVSFFMLDTRRYRSPNDLTNGSDPVTGQPTKSMLGAQQLADLLAWLKQPEPHGVNWKFVVSSVPFTRNWWGNAQDTWRGYLGEREIILQAMWDAGERGVGIVVLSGDRHEFAATAFPPPPDGIEEIVGLGVNALAHGPGAAQLSPDATSLHTRRKRWSNSVTVHEFSVSPLNMFYLPVRTYAESSTSAEYVSDVCIKYIPDGNSKFGAISISNPTTSDQSLLHYRLFVDGIETWSHTLTTPPDTRSGAAKARDAIWG